MIGKSRYRRIILIMIIVYLSTFVALWFCDVEKSEISNNERYFDGSSAELKWRSNYLVTGGAGFIGSHLSDRLLDQWKRDEPCRVIILDNFNSYYSPEPKEENINSLRAHHPSRVLDGSFVLIRGSINNITLLKTIFTRFSITHVAHLAALAGVRLPMKYVSNYNQTNYEGTQAILDQAAAHHVSIFVFASSSSVYGQTSQIPFTEIDPCALPLSPYAATKRAAEILSHVYFNLYALNITILRLFNVYGPRGRPDMMPARLFLASIDQTETIDIFNNGTIMRDWTYIDDVVEAFIKALNKPLGYQIFNIGYGHPVSMSAFIERIERLSGNSRIRRNLRSGHSHAAEPSITHANTIKARQLLDFVALVSLDNGLNETWTWFKNKHRPTKTRRHRV